MVEKFDRSMGPYFANLALVLMVVSVFGWVTGHFERAALGFLFTIVLVLFSIRSEIITASAGRQAGKEK